MEVTKTKSAIVSGSFDIYEMATDQLIHAESLSEEVVFENRFRELTGDERALSYDIRRRTDDIRRERTDVIPEIRIDETQGMRIEDGKEVPLPTNEELLLDSADLLKERTRSIIRDERNLLEI